jgi:hypothetical protein
MTEDKTVIAEKDKMVAHYHWWSHPGEPSPYTNLRTPILLSIATLRAVTDMKIVVIDTTDSSTPRDWGHFPEKLKFEVWQKPSYLMGYQKHIDGWRYLSRIYDIMESRHPLHHTVMYTDSDTFWLRDPLPFDKDPNKFVFDGWNSGFFYFKRSDRINLFYDMFDAYTKGAIFSKDIREIMKKFVGYDAWYGVWDEMILTYMAHTHPEFFNKTTVNEHSTIRTLQYANKNTVKMLHANGLMVANPIAKCHGELDHCRGLLCLVIKEFYDNMMKVLDENDLKMIFTEKELARYLPMQMNLFSDLPKILATKDECGHFHIQKCLTNM